MASIEVPRAEAEGEACVRCGKATDVDRYCPSCDHCNCHPDTLRDFLLARIAEDEAQARFYDDVPRERYETTGLEASPEYATVYVSPARILAQCEAHRQIVESRAAIDIAPTADCPPGQGFVWLDGAHTAVANERERTLRCIALPYADHPDYRPEWRP